MRKRGRGRPGKYIVNPEGKRLLRSYNIEIGKKRTTVRLSPGVRDAIKKIAVLENCHTDELYTYIARHKLKGVSNSTAIREFALKYFMDASTPAGHRKAGHGKLIK